MQTSNLQAFIIVAETHSFSRAAETLHLTQSAVSKRIGTLEQELEVRLFDRIGHRIALTEAGNELLPRARRILAEVEDSRRTLQNLSGEIRGTLSLGTSHHIGLHRLPPYLEQFSRRHPQVELDLHFMNSESICDAVVHGDLELGIVTLPHAPHKDLACNKVWTDSLSFVCGPRHPFHAAPRVSLQQLARHTAILPTRESATYQLLAACLGETRLKQGTSTDNLETIRMLISINLGWGLLPEGMIEPPLQAFQVSGIRLVRELGVVTHHQRTLSNAAKSIIKTIN